MNHLIYLRRRGKICVPAEHSGEPLPLNYVASLAKNLETLGYGMSPALLHACRGLSMDQLAELYQQLITDLQMLKGAHREFQPMYPNFPVQVMEMSEGELYLNALLHYWTEGKFRPNTESVPRPPLQDAVQLQYMDLGTTEEFERLFTQIVSSNASLSKQDKEDVTWFVRTYGNDIRRLLPNTICQKETVAFLSALLARYTTQGAEFVRNYCRTATDVLRLAVALSGGDISLAESTKFRNFTRSERKLLLTLLDVQDGATEDMLRWKKRWIRLGEKLHPGEYRKHYPRAAAAFDVLRNDLPFVTFNGKVERSLAEWRVLDAVDQLTTRPGDFARRLDHLLRLNPSEHESILSAFARVADRVSTPVLVQVQHHFRTRLQPSSLRVFFPKGNVAKAQAVENRLPELPAALCDRAEDTCTEALIQRFQALPALGKCYVDPELVNYMVPLSQRSASKALRTVARGSRWPLPESDTLRFFVWWKNGRERTDIDLSAALFDADFNLTSYVAYYNLKMFGGHHSGDIVDAPDGASEFIDISTRRVRENGAAYVVMVLNSYTSQPFCDLPECFAGWMARARANSGEIYDPRTVQDRLDISADTRISIPLIMDLARNQVIWSDLALTRNPHWHNNLESNRRGIQLMLKSLVELRKPNLYDLLMLHVRARGELVPSEAEADTVFSVANETPFQLETIGAEYLQ